MGTGRSVPLAVVLVLLTSAPMMLATAPMMLTAAARTPMAAAVSLAMAAIMTAARVRFAMMSVIPMPAPMTATGVLATLVLTIVRLGAGMAEGGTPIPFTSMGKRSKLRTAAAERLATTTRPGTAATERWRAAVFSGRGTSPTERWGTSPTRPRTATSEPGVLAVTFRSPRFATAFRPTGFAAFATTVIAAAFFGPLAHPLAETFEHRPAFAVAQLAVVVLVELLHRFADAFAKILAAAVAIVVRGKRRRRPNQGQHQRQTECLLHPTPPLRV